jgi:hypothetical protein
MSVQRLCVIVGLLLCAVPASTPALAQGNMVIERAQRASSLSGIVEDGMGAAIAGVAVAECSAHFNDCVTVERTDKDGRFNVRSARKGRVHNLQFLSLGMDQERVTVTLSHFSRKLRIKLVVGT